jgi:hypothetical protein
MFHICSQPPLKEKAECPFPSKPFRLRPLATDQAECGRRRRL